MSRIHLCCRGCGRRIASMPHVGSKDAVRWNWCGVTLCAEHERTRRKLRADLEGLALP